MLRASLDLHRIASMGGSVIAVSGDVSSMGKLFKLLKGIGDG